MCWGRAAAPKALVEVLIFQQYKPALMRIDAFDMAGQLCALKSSLPNVSRNINLIIESWPSQCQVGH